MTRWELRWSERADRDFGRARSPRAATRWAHDLLRRVRLLSEQPELGTSVVLGGAPTVYRRVLVGDYGVFYRLDAVPRVVLVMRVWHLRRDPAAFVLE